MKTLMILITSLVLACSQLSSNTADEKSFSMQKLWDKNANESEVIKTFGTPSITTENGIIYHSPGITFAENGHFFEKNGKLNSQFIVLSKEALERFKQFVNCSWSEKAEIISKGHAVYEVIKGECKQKNLFYESQAHDTYELKWKRP